MRGKWVRFFILAIFIVFVIPNNVKAIENGDYIIKKFDIDIRVNEDKILDVTENIQAYFYENKTGIIRKLPVKEKINKFSNALVEIAKVSDIKVNEHFSTYNDYIYQVIEIGDKNNKVVGEKNYVVNYSYKVIDNDEAKRKLLCFSLVGSEWNTDIERFSFKITMPKTIDKSMISFRDTTGKLMQEYSVSYEVDGNIVIGEIVGKLPRSNDISIMINLPEGYFNKEKYSFEPWMCLMLIILGVVVVASIILSILYKVRVHRMGNTEITDLPEQFNSLDIAFLYKGKLSKKDSFSILIYLANKGYLKIVQDGDNFKINKLKNYDGNDENERFFLEKIFENFDELTKDNLLSAFFDAFPAIASNIRRPENKERIFNSKVNVVKNIMIVGLLLSYSLLFFNFMKFTTVDIAVVIVIWILVGIQIILIFTNIELFKKIGLLLSIAFFPILTLAFSFEAITYNRNLTFAFILFIIGLLCLIVVYISLERRTVFGYKYYKQILNFKKHIESIDDKELGKNIEEKTMYFYNVLPFSYVLGFSRSWIKRGKMIGIKENYLGFNIDELEKFMKWIKIIVDPFYK